MTFHHFRELVILMVFVRLEVNAQFYTTSCNFFNYVNDNGFVYGLITLSPYERVSSLLLRASFTVSARLVSNYVGSIEPLGAEMQLLESYNRGSPISYRVNFPVTNPLPKLTTLTVNDRVLCYGAGDVPGTNQYVTTITLEHILYYRGGSGPNVVYQQIAPRPQPATTQPTFIIEGFPDNQEFNVIIAKPTKTSKRPPPPESNWENTSQPYWERPPPDKWGPPPNRHDRPPPPPPKKSTPKEPEPTEEYQEPETPKPKPTRPSLGDRNVASGGSCGVNGLDSVPLIYRGTSYERGKWPWLVAIFKRKYTGLGYICAGTLVSDRHVVTAAHCMQRKNSYTASKDIVVRLGVYNLDDWADETVVIRNLENAAIHEAYNSTTLANDILVLTLDKPVQYSLYIKAACLWSGITDLNAIVESSGVVAGWGASEAGPAGRGEPRMVRMPIVSTTTCRASKLEFHKLTSSKTLCAGDRNGAGPCLGDSGGGLYILDSNTGRWRLRGIVSISLWSQSGEDTCNLNDYIVFTDTAQYLPWIKAAMST